MSLKFLFSLYSFLLFFLKGEMNCQELDKKSKTMIGNILNEFQSLGYSQIKQEYLVNPVLEILDGGVDHFNSYCVKSFLKLYRTSPEEIWVNEQNVDTSSERIIHDLILICRELPDWQNICIGDTSSAVDLVASDLHLATLLIYEAKKNISDFQLDAFCDISKNLMNEDKLFYNYFCVVKLFKNNSLTENGIQIDLKDSITVCSTTTFWSIVCTENNSDNLFMSPETQLLASSLFFQVKNNRDKYMFDNSNVFDGILPKDFCKIVHNINLKGEILKYFNILCVDELSKPTKLLNSGITWFPSTRSVIEICKDNPLWTSCFSGEYEKSDVLDHFSENIELSHASKPGLISLLASILMQQIHELPLFMFSSLYYQFAEMNDMCNIAKTIQKETDKVSETNDFSNQSQVHLGPFFNSICWRVLSTYPITFNTGIGTLTQPIKTLEAISVCKSSLFWNSDCIFSENENSIYLNQITILSQELLIGSKKFYNFPKHTFCIAAKNIIFNLNNLNQNLGSSIVDFGNYNINWILNNVQKIDSHMKLSGISSGFFNRECVRELLGPMEKNMDLIPINFAINICSTSLRWEKCSTQGHIIRRYLTEFVASEFYYGLLAEPEIKNLFDWADICLISTITVPEEYDNINTVPFIPYFNHHCSLNFLKLFQSLEKKIPIFKTETNSYSFTKFIKICVHNYFWRAPCGELVELDLLANSLLFGSHQFESMQNIPENLFCKPARNLLEIDPNDYPNECIKEVMSINSFFTSEIAEGSCALTHRFPACHGFPEEYTSIANALFMTMYQYFPKTEVPNFMEFCGIVHSIYTDPEFNDSPYYFDAICAKNLHQSNLDISFLEISILCSRISTNLLYKENFSMSILTSEFFKKSRSINSLKKWEVQYFYPLAKSVWESIEKDEDLFLSFNYKCVEIARSVISTDSYKLRLDDAISLCSGSIAFKIYCKNNQNPNLQHLISEIIKGMSEIIKIKVYSEDEIQSICTYAESIYNHSIEKLPLSRNISNNVIKYPYFLTSCVEILISGILLPNRIINMALNEAVSICTKSSRSSKPCKNENILVSIFSIGLYSEMRYLPEFFNLQITDLCNISSKLIDVSMEEYLEKCTDYLGNYKAYIPNTNNLKIQLSELQKQRICTRPYKWPKCKIKHLERELYSIKLETLASKLMDIFKRNNLDLWNFERHCLLAEKILKLNAKSSYKDCIRVLEEFEYLEMVKQKPEKILNPLFLYYRLENSVILKICNQLTSNDECIESSNQLSGLLADNFYSISTNYLDLNMIKSSDFCIISEILLQKGNPEEMKRNCPYVLSQITNLEHWPQIMLTPELAMVICNDLNILNLNCIPANKSKGITEELSMAINEIAIQLFFFRKKYISTFNPESSCLMAESFIQFGIKNQYFDNLCNNLISYDIWNFSENFDSKYNYYWSIGKQDPETLFKFIRDEAKKICFELEQKLSEIYLRSHNNIKRRDKKQNKFNKNYTQKVLKKILSPLKFSSGKNIEENSDSKLTKEEERSELKKKLMTISKSKKYVALNDKIIKEYGPENVDYKLAKKYFGEFLISEYNSVNDSIFVYEPPEFNWNLFTQKLAIVSNRIIGIAIKVSDPKFGGLSSLIHKWGYIPQGTVQGAQYIYRTSRYINKYMISPKKSYLIWKETLISMNHSIIPKWRESWEEEIRKPNPLDEQPLPTCEGVRSNNLLKQLGMDRKKIGMVALANIDSFVSQLTEAAHDLNLSSIKFSDFCIVGIILFNLKSYSRTESFNYQCIKWVKQIGYIESYTENTNLDINEKFSKKSIDRLKNNIRKQIPTESARRICASTNRWMSCNGESDIDKKLKIDMLATELVRLSRITGLEFRDMCEVAIQIANSQDFNQRCPLLLQSIVGNYNRALHVCKSTSFWKSCHYSKKNFDLKLLEHLDTLTLELTLGLNEIFADAFTFEEICSLTDKFVASEYFKKDCVESIIDFLITQKLTRSILNIYGETRFSVKFKHLVSVALTTCYDTLRWQQITCILDENDNYSLFEKQWIDLVSEELFRKIIFLKKKIPEVSIFLRDNERDALIEKFNFENDSKYKVILPPNLKYQDICKHVSKISKTRYFNINCVQAVSDTFQAQLSKITIDGNNVIDFENRNVYKSIIKVPNTETIEEICKGSIFWETCSNSYLNLFLDLEMNDENKIAADIVVNDIMVSILQLNEIEIEERGINFNYKQTSIKNGIQKLAIKTLNSLNYSDFCKIGLWYSNVISKSVNEKYSEFQNTLTEKITYLILKNMYPNRKLEREDETITDETKVSVPETLDIYIEDSILKLPETFPELKKPPEIMLRNHTDINYILVFHSQYYDNSRIYKIKLDNNDLFLDFYLNRNVSHIFKEKYGNIINIKPISGLKLHMYQLPNGELDYPKLNKLHYEDKIARFEAKNLLNIMKKKPDNFHKSILPHATIQIMKKTDHLTSAEKKIKKQWLKNIKEEYYYKKGREVASNEWNLRELAVDSYDGTGEIKWEIQKKKDIPNPLYALFSEDARRRRKEGKLFNKGLYKARVHHFLLKKLMKDQEIKRENNEKSRKIILKSSHKKIEGTIDNGLHLENLYSEEEIGIVNNIAAMIGYNQIAVDLIY